jgi:hypothetical protein
LTTPRPSARLSEIMGFSDASICLPNLVVLQERKRDP